MIKIGIVPTYSENKTRPFLNTLNFVSNYPKRLLEVNSTPLGILFPDGNFYESELQSFDGFLIPGGSVIRPYHLLTIHYAITHNKPLLGVCLGLQALGAYDYVVNNIKSQNKTVNYETIMETYLRIMSNEDLYLKEVENHDPEPTFYNDSVPKASHMIYIKPNTKLFEIYNASEIVEPSIHNSILKQISKSFIVSAVSKEGYIEGIEYQDQNNFVIGVQFHPELEEKNNILFKRFVDECRQRMIN